MIHSARTVANSSSFFTGHGEPGTGERETAAQGTFTPSDSGEEWSAAREKRERQGKKEREEQAREEREQQAREERERQVREERERQAR